MFKDTPRVGADQLLPEMDRFGIDKALIPVVEGEPLAPSLLAEHPDRFLGCFQLQAGNAAAVRRATGIVAAGLFPAGERLAIDDATWFPHYAACEELGLPVFVNVGVPGPLVPAAPQHWGGLDPVLSAFPDLVLVTRHGAEPWVHEVIALMRAWPNLHYSTSAFAPRYYPAEIVEFANADGADRVIYGGYFPSGLSLERIFRELAHVPFHDDVWPKFLRDNAFRVLGLGVEGRGGGALN